MIPAPDSRKKKEITIALLFSKIPVLQVEFSLQLLKKLRKAFFPNPFKYNSDAYNFVSKGLYPITLIDIDSHFILNASKVLEIFYSQLRLELVKSLNN